MSELCERGLTEANRTYSVFKAPTTCDCERIVCSVHEHSYIHPTTYISSTNEKNSKTSSTLRKIFVAYERAKPIFYNSQVVTEKKIITDIPNSVGCWPRILMKNLELFIS